MIVYDKTIYISILGTCSSEGLFVDHTLSLNLEYVDLNISFYHISKCISFYHAGASNH